MSRGFFLCRDALLPRLLPTAGGSPHSCQSGLSAREVHSLLSLLKPRTPNSSSWPASGTPRGLDCCPLRPASPCLSSPSLDSSSPDLRLPVFFWPLKSWLTLSLPQMPSLTTHTKVVPPGFYHTPRVFLPSHVPLPGSLLLIYLRLCACRLPSLRES